MDSLKILAKKLEEKAKDVITDQVIHEVEQVKLGFRLLTESDEFHFVRIPKEWIAENNDGTYLHLSKILTDFKERRTAFLAEKELNKIISEFLGEQILPFD